MLSSHPRHHRLWFWVGTCFFIALFTVFAVLFSLNIPFNHNPDEWSHENYIELIATAHQLPSALIHERQQPPLYYLMGAVLWSFSHSVVSARVLSIVLGALTVLLTFITARVLWPTRTAVALVPGAIVALWPELQWATSYVTDDSLALASAALLTLAIVVVVVRRPSRKTAVLTGVAVAVGMLSKETDFALAAIAVILALILWRKSQLQYRIIVLAIPLILSGWWYIRNIIFFHHILPPLTPLFSTAIKLDHVSEFPKWLHNTMHSTIAFFSTLTIAFTGRSEIVYYVFELCIGFFACAGLVLAWRQWKTWNHQQRILCATFAALPCIAFLQMLWSSITIDYQSQGRYLLIALPAAALGTAAIARRLVEKFPRNQIAIGAGLAFLVGLTADIACIWKVKQ